MYRSVVRNRWLRLSSSDSWLGRMERRLLTVFGPAQLGKVGKQPDRSPNRTAGVQGEWELRRDSTGRTYLVRPPDGGQDADTQTPPEQPPETQDDR